jgi:hypothetical protein
VIGITRGCAEQLSREQLQGVIAHEFSHILNGDMRLNIRLIGVLHGILLLGLIGQMLFRIIAYSGHRRSSNNKNGGGIVIVILVTGLALVVLGYLGTVMGNLIKAAVSRQREFLADASAVQFTRDPDGIAGALKRIGGLVYGSKLKSPNAAEASHMYFAQGVSSGLTSMLATHPPLPERIRRIDPQWDGKFPDVAADVAANVAADATVTAVAGAQMAGFTGDEAIAAARTVPVDVVEHASDQIGEPRESHRQYAAELVERLPDVVVAAAHEPYGARAVLFALLLDDDPDVRGRQLDALARLATPDVVKLTEELAPKIDKLDVRTRLPLVDMSLPALRAMSDGQYRAFTQCFGELVRADDRLALFEWSLHHILLRHLKPQFEPVRPVRTSYWGMQRLGQPCSVLLSTLAYVGHEDDQAAQAFAYADDLLPEVPMKLLPRDQCNLHQLQDALEQLQQVASKQQQRLIDAAAACICADREVSTREAELLRAVCDMLDCPMPPLLPGQRVEPVTAATRRTTTAR